MKMKIEEFHKKHPIFSSAFMLFAGALIGWAVTWILPSRDVTVSNIPQKELTCTLEYSYPMVARKSADANLQLLYGGRPVNAPYAYGITITNTGAYAVSNEDFKDAFTIDFSGSSQLVYAQVVKPSNGTIKEEVLSNTKIEGTILSITDFYLNTNESFGIYLIVDGKPDTISYHSRISDISRLTLRNTPKEHHDDQIKTVIFLSLIPILFAVGTIIWTSISWRKWRKKEQEFIQKYLEEQQKMNKLDGFTLDLESTNKDKLHAVFPECFTEGRLDIDKLLSLCGEYITDDFEKYEFKWKGKSDCLRLAQKRSTATLRPVPEDSVNWDTTQNLYIEGDNLEVLKLLHKSYFRKVKMIYIDPPYNTGNDFVYKDDFADPMARYKEVTAQTTKSNPETMGRYHTNWLNMMYPRLRLAANLLRDDGVIFISIDDGEQSNMRKLCDEVFGEENFMAQIIWQKVYSPRMDVQGFSTSHDYILCYVKSSIESIQQEAFSQNAAQFNFVDSENGKRYRRRSIRKEGSHSTRSERPNLWFALPAPDGTEVYPYKPDGTEGCWRWSMETYRENEQQNIVEWIKTENGWQAYAKQYLDTDAVKPPETLWLHQEVGHNHSAAENLKKLLEGKVFESPKPQELIQKMLKLSTYSDEGDIVLDFFSGSATTAHAVMQLNADDGGNRRFIMVQLPEVCDEKSEAARNGYPNICEIGKERIRRAAEKLMQQITSGHGNENGEGWGCGMPTTEAEREYVAKNVLDIGFKVFRLDSSNLKLWDDTPIESGDLDSLFSRLEGVIDNLKPGRSETDLVYEILLKMGYPLTADVAALEVDGLTVYTVEQNNMLICLQPGVTAEIVEKLAALEPQKIVLTENALADNSAMSNAHYLLQNQGIELKIV